MALQLSNAAAIVACDALADLPNSGAGQASLIIYEGTIPTDVDTAIGAQTPLVTFPLPNPLFSPAVDASPGAIATGDVGNIATEQASATGTASFFRILNADDVAVFQGTVTAVSGGGDLEISSTSIISGIDVTVVSLSLVMPE